MSSQNIKQFSPQDVEGTVRAWAAITILKFRERMREEKMSQNHLYKSFTFDVTKDSEGYPTAVSIGFNLYGRFVDMGVGRGFQRGSRSEIGAERFDKKRNLRGQLLSDPYRRPKKWYSKTIYGEMMSLHRILKQKYLIESAKIVEEELTLKINIKY